MTEQEDLAIKGQTVKELSETRQRLVCYEAKAETYRKQFQSAENLLSTFNADSHVMDQNKWPSYADVVSVWNGVVDSRKRIDQLTERLRQWGALP